MRINIFFRGNLTMFLTNDFYWSFVCLRRMQMRVMWYHRFGMKRFIGDRKNFCILFKKNLADELQVEVEDSQFVILWVSNLNIIGKYISFHGRKFIISIKRQWNVLRGPFCRSGHEVFRVTKMSMTCKRILLRKKPITRWCIEINLGEYDDIFFSDLDSISFVVSMIIRIVKCLLSNNFVYFLGFLSLFVIKIFRQVWKRTRNFDRNTLVIHMNRARENEMFWRNDERTVGSSLVYIKSIA